MKTPNNLLNCACSTTTLFFFFLFFSLSQSLISQQLAFPTAEGAGAYSTGGRGGSVSIVTNLNDSGPGSLRSYSKVSNTTIVFNVSGIINLKSPLDFYGHNVTIAGQTTPEGGITIEGSTVRFQDNKNMIVRYLRFRGGYHNSDLHDSITGYNLKGVIFDHCSISFGGDEGFSLAVSVNHFADNVTIQNCLIAESKTGSIMGSQGALDDFGDFSMISNLYYNITHRFPNVVGNTRYDIINNYIHNAKWRLMNGQGGYKLNQIGNFYDYGNLEDHWVRNESLNMHTCIDGAGRPVIYTTGNIINGIEGHTKFVSLSNSIDELNSDNKLTWRYYYDNSSCGGQGKRNKGDQLESSFFRNTPYPLNGKAPTIYAATGLKDRIVPTVGASKRLNADGSVSDNHDVLESDWKRNIMEGNYIPKMDQSKYATPPITSVMRPSNYDSDNDGMADEWEILMFNTLSHDGTKDSNGNGYTDLEEFLNQVDFQAAKDVPVERIEVSPSSAVLQLKETLQLHSTYIPSNTINKNGTWSSSDTSIATVDAKGLVTPVSVGDGPISVGDVEITYRSGDGRVRGTSLVTVVPRPVLVYAGDDQAICNGGPSTLTATGGHSYLWNTGERTASIRISPSTSRTYTVTGYDSTGKHSDTDEVYVEVSSSINVSAGNDVTIYSGESTTLKATGATTYKWSTGATGAKITVNPKMTTTYTVTGTKSGCGSSSGTVTVTVIDRIGVMASAGSDVSICLGSTTTLTATGGSTYLWSTGDKTANILVSPDETTTYTVTAYDSTGNNSDTDDVIVTVSPLPKVDAGPDVTINSGESTTLTAKGADSYSWSNGEVTSSINVSPTDTTTYTVIGKTKDCEAIDFVTVFSVEASVKVSAGEDTDICLGSSTTLTATGGTTYHWSTGATTASITVNPEETTIYTVTAFSVTGKGSDTAAVTVTVNPLPIVDAGNEVTIDSGESATLTATGATSYRWSTGARSASIIVSPTATRTYTVTGNSNGCEATDTVRVIVLNTVEVTADAGEDQNICAGSSTTLTATGGATYRWSNGATTASINITPTATTTYTVTAYDSTGEHFNTDEVTVTVNPLPQIDAGKNVTIDAGESTVLTATGGTTYKWSTGATTASITVSPTASTTYTVTGTSNGCEATDTVRVTVVNPVEVTANAGPDQNLCLGSSTTLTATGGATYLWNTGATTASIKISPSTTTTYSVTAYDSTGKYSDTDEVKVSINPLPVVDAGSNITINVGESRTLTATGATTYKWSNGATGASIKVNPTATTTYTVTGIRNGCEATDTVKVTVTNPLKVVANAGKNQDVCEGSSVKLTATGGDTYLWSTGAKTASITVNPKSTSKYSVTAYIGNVSDKAEVEVKVNSKPNVKITNGSEASILEGEFITLSATGAKTYKWNNGATQPNIAVRPNATQSYSVTGHDNKCSTDKSIKVNVFEKVVAGAGKDVTIYRNEKTVLTATGPKNSEFLWSTGETAKSITVSPLEDTEYSVMVYHALDSDTANVIVNVIDRVDDQIIEDSALEFLIHPNPTDGELNIKISGLTNLSSIHLYDLSGKSLYNEIINESDHQSYIKTLNLSNYASGIYLLQLIDNQKVITKKVVLR